MTSISARIPEDLEKELDRFIEEEKLDKSTAVRKLISEGIEDWKKEKAFEMLVKGETTFSRAAEIADMDVWSFGNYVKQQKVNWVNDEKVKDDLEAV